MFLTALLIAFGLAGAFAVRTFLPLLMLAVLLRWGGGLDWAWGGAYRA